MLVNLCCPDHGGCGPGCCECGQVCDGCVIDPHCMPSGATLAQDRGRMVSQIESLTEEVQILKEKLKVMMLYKDLMCPRMTFALLFHRMRRIVVRSRRRSSQTKVIQSPSSSRC